MVLKVYKNMSGYLMLLLFSGLMAGVSLEAKAAGPVFWDWPKIQAFSALELDGATIDGQGFLMAGMDARSFTGEGPEVYWRIISDGNGGYFTGTGHGGKILHTSKSGEAELYAELEGSEIFSLLLLADGSLLAGCGPEGEVYRLDNNGDATLLGVVPGGYAWSMYQARVSGTIFIAGGSPASLYRLQSDDTLELVEEFPAQNTLDVTGSPDGGLYVATQGPGFIYHLDASLEKSSLLLEMRQDEARQFLHGPDKELYVIGFSGEDQESIMPNGLAPGGDSSSEAMLSVLFGEPGPEDPRSIIYRLDADGTANPVWTSEKEFMIAAWDENLGWVGGGALDEESGKAILYALDFPAGEHPLAQWDGGDILDILLTENQPDVDLIVCQAYPGSVTSLGRVGDNPHHALSTPLDGGRVVRWGRLSWDGIAGDGHLEWSVRGGNSSVPDDSWSDWSQSWTGDNHAIDLAPSRFLQWRVAFPQSNGSRQPWRLTRVSVSAWQNNSAPVIGQFVLEQRVAMEPGNVMNGSDNVMQLFRSGLFAEFSKTSTASAEPDPALVRMARPVHVFSWHVQDAEDDRLLFTLQYRQTGTDGWRTIINDSPESMGSWDTSEVNDGYYDVRLLATDKKDNPHSKALSSRQVLGPFKVDNKAPVIKSLRLEQVSAGFRVRFSARDESSDVAAAQIQLPDGSVERLDPKDGLCDSPQEEFDAVISWPRPGATVMLPEGEPESWLVGIGIKDLGGNFVAVEGEVR
jgi:hypothetical protein